MAGYSYELASHLIVQSSGFARAASAGVNRDISFVAMRTLSNLSTSDGLRVGELARLEGIAQPSMTSVVNSMVKDGLAMRTADPRDARASVITLTSAGAAELREFRRRLGESVAPFIEALTDADRAALERTADLLEELSARLRT